MQNENHVSQYTKTKVTKIQHGHSDNPVTTTGAKLKGYHTSRPTTKSMLWHSFCCYWRDIIFILCLWSWHYYYFVQFVVTCFWFWAYSRDMIYILVILSLAYFRWICNHDMILVLLAWLFSAYCHFIIFILFPVAWYAFHLPPTGVTLFNGFSFCTHRHGIIFILQLLVPHEFI